MLSDQADKFLLIGVDSLFAGSPADFIPGQSDLLGLNYPSLEKAYRNGWTLIYWSWRCPRQYTTIVEFLKHYKLWELTDPRMEDSLLLATKSQETKYKTYLSLLERHFGANLDNGVVRLAILESDSLIAKQLQSYVAHRAKVHESPRCWLNMVALSPELLDGYLLPEPLELAACESSSG